MLYRHVLLTIIAFIACAVYAGVECSDDRCQEDQLKSSLLSWYEEWRRGFQVDYITINDVRESYDFIVIGAGVGGSVVAHRLAMHESHPSVLLLEAGGKHNTSGLHAQVTPTLVQTNQLTDIDWQYKSEPSDGHCCDWYNDGQLAMPRGKVTGGSGVLNYMMWVRGHRADWDELMNVDAWKWEDVLPFFKRTESLHAYDGFRSRLQDVRGYDGPIIVNSANELKSDESIFEESAIAACEAEGIPYLALGQNNGDNVGIAYTEMNVDDSGQRNNAFLGYNKYMRRRYQDEYESGAIKLDILPFAHVTKIEFNHNRDKNGKAVAMATAVRFADVSDGQRKMHKVKVNQNGEVILSAGAFGSPHLLKLSGIGAKDELESFGISVIKELRGVGENLSDHVMNFVRYHWAPEYIEQGVTAKKIERIVDNFAEFKEYLFRGKGYLAVNVLQANAFIKSNYSTASYPDLQLYFAAGWGGRGEFMNWKPDIHVEKQCGDKTYWRDLDNVDNIVTVVGLQHPKSLGWVRLQSSDPFDLPLVQPNFLKEQEDVDRQMYGLKVLDRVMHQPSMRRLWDERMDCKVYGDIYADDEAMEKFVRDSVYHIYHPTGTCKMGDVERDEMAVVDNQLRVKGVSNLRVADASILPHQTSGNTQLPVFMIGERAAEFVLKRWSSK